MAAHPDVLPVGQLPAPWPKDKLLILVFEDYEFSDEDQGMRLHEMQAVRETFVAGLLEGPIPVGLLPAGVSVAVINLN